MKLVPKLLLMRQDMIAGDKIFHLLRHLPKIPSENVWAKKFRKRTLTHPNLQMTVMWYNQGEQIVLVGLERHKKKKEYLADEEPFNDKAPLYFSESDHYVSPIFQLKQLREEVTKMLEKQGMLRTAIWILYITNNTLINKEDLQDDVWLRDRIIVCDNAESLTTDYDVEGPFEMETNLYAFRYANEHTVWDDSEIQKKDEDMDRLLNRLANSIAPKEENEEENCDKDTQEDEMDEIDEPESTSSQDEPDLELFDFDSDPFADVQSPFSNLKEPPHVPVLEDGLRAEALPRLEKSEDALKEMVGCTDIKKQIEELEILTRYNKMRLDANPNAKTHAVSLHAIFQGAPGTGKTTLCKIYASLLYHAGVLSNGHVVVCTRSTFLGTNWGSEEGNLQLAIKAARGGVLMIDEAYLLYSTHPNDPGKNVLPLLMTLLADEKERDIAVVLCGYKEPMENLMSLNEGLASRFSHKFDFPEFSVPQLLEISKRRVAAYNYHFTRQAWLQYGNMVAKAYENRDPKTWANAREVANLLEKIYIHHADRCWHQHLTDPQKQNAITVADIKPVELIIHTKKQRCIGFR